MRSFFSWVFAAGMALTAAAQAQQPISHPLDSWEFAAEAGYLTKIRNNSPFNYRIAPVNLAWRSPAMFEIWRGESGARLAVRNRLALVVETIRRGPEDHYIAFAAAPSFELWSADRRHAAFWEIGGGAGLLNSKGVAGGQGQDFAFNWFTQLGLRRQLNDKVGVTGGLYFTHHSNLGMTDPNPGIDVLGVNVGVVWRLD